MSWMDAGDVRKGRGGTPTGKKRGKGNKLSAEDAKLIMQVDKKTYKKAKGSKDKGPTLTAAQQRDLIKKAKAAERKMDGKKKRGWF